MRGATGPGTAWSGATSFITSRLRIVDSLSARLASSGPGPVVVDLPPEVSPEQQRMVSEAARRQVDYLGSRAPDMIVGVSLVDAKFGTHADFGNRGRSRPDFFSGTVNGQSFCLIAYPFYAPDPEEPRRLGNLDWAIRQLTDTTFASNAGGYPLDILGPCALHPVHGSPGPAIRS